MKKWRKKRFGENINCCCYSKLNNGSFKLNNGFIINFFNVFKFSYESGKSTLLLLSNMLNMMTVKLDNTNYIVWKHQISMVLETYSLFELLEEPQLIPKKFIKDLFGTYAKVVNLDFLV